MKKSLALISLVCLPLGLSACGDKTDASSSDVPKVSAEANVPAPAGKAWSDVIAITEQGGYLMGNPNAPIKVAEFGSYTCSHCAEFAETSADTISQMVNTGKMSFEFRPFIRDPLDMSMALLAACNGPETYFALSHQFMAYQPTLFEKVQGAGDAAYGAAASKAPNERFIALSQLAGLIEFGKQRGLSEEKAVQCLADTKAAETAAAHVQEATSKYDISGTPTLLINDEVVKNAASWDVLHARLKEAGL